jgi:tripartite-type tricarboxylate transporter receptor subunit TctC
MRRFIFSLSLCLILCLFVVSIGAAQPYPNRPIQMVIPFPPGGGGDIVGRLLGEEIGKILKVNVIPMNKPGAAFTLGTDAVVRSKKDGYTIAYTNAPAIVHTRVVNPETVPYDPDKDLEPLGLHVFFSLPVAVQENSPWKTFTDLVDFAKKNPGKLRVGIPGIGSTSHLNMEITQSLAGVQFTPIPFKGGQSAVTQLLGGHVDIIYESFSNVIPHVETGKLRILLMTKKMPEFPGIPTMTELGYKQDLISGWQALYAPIGVPEEVIRALVPAIEKAVKNPELKSKVEKMGYIVDYRSPAELKKLMADEYELALKVAIRIGLRK